MEHRRAFVSTNALKKTAGALFERRGLSALAKWHNRGLTKKEFYTRWLSLSKPPEKAIYA